MSTLRKRHSPRKKSSEERASKKGAPIGPHAHRNSNIDELRGICCLLMLLHHIFYMPGIWFYIHDYGFFLDTIATIAATGFYIILGMTGRTRIQHPILIALHASWVTIQTWYYLGSFKAVLQGSLHLIAIYKAIDLLLPQRFPRIRQVCWCILGFIGHRYYNMNVGVGVDRRIRYVLGLQPFTWDMGAAIDYFSVLKWFKWVALGTLIGPYIPRKSLSKRFLPQHIQPVCNVLRYIGRNALWFYTMHLTIILLFSRLILGPYDKTREYLMYKHYYDLQNHYEKQREMTVDLHEASQNEQLRRAHDETVIRQRGEEEAIHWMEHQDSHIGKGIPDL